VIRVSGVLEMISREVELRPNEYLWNYEGLWQSAPETVLENVCAAPDVAGMLDALGIDGISKEMLAALKAKVAGNPKMQAFLAVGFDELKGWFAEKQKDPKFDPYGDEEEEGE
jgi:hypothetical protein